MGYLLTKLESYPEINLVVVADHGQINIDRFFYISDYVDKKMLAFRPYCSSICTIQPAMGYSAKHISDKMTPLFNTSGFRHFM